MQKKTKKTCYSKIKALYLPKNLKQSLKLFEHETLFANICTYNVFCWY
ncbi:hypothetical protein SAMN05216463_11438 [Xylanibacter ruminicola]|uniref:Uncharacterized protein n=1 Tax=Xylanibacter ruminicola TaxID=839 RepID=A0A1M6VV93_XYLRU|nr:hypothetical protein SAMN05216463_11438 [Xylanibacter ruminicola]